MSSIKKEIAGLLSDFLPLDKSRLEDMLVAPPEPGMGDYALPCFTFAKLLGKPPADIAAELAGSPEWPPYIKEVKAAGPYLNLFTDRSALFHDILGRLCSEDGEGLRPGTCGTGIVVIDYSSPNIAKHLGVHHLRSAIIGKSLYRILETCGFKCTGINHLGDWGTSFGKLIAAFERYGETAGIETTVSRMQELYIRYSKEAEANPQLDDLARAAFHRLENGDQQAVAIWKQLKKISVKEFERIYEMLGIEFDAYMPESFYLTMSEDLIRRLEARGLATESEDAVIVLLDDENLPPLMLKKKDGATLYATRDLCAAEYRWTNYRFEHCLYVVGGEQKLYFRQLKAVLAKMGYDWADMIEHVDFGLLKFPDPETGRAEVGSTREGRMILLEEALTNGIEKAKEKIRENLAKLPPGTDMEKLAARIGIGALVFSDLAVKRNKDVIFDWDRMLDFQGDTGPYVQYAHARLCSMLRKAPEKATAEADLSLLALPEEWRLARLLEDFPSRIVQAAEGREPSIIANFLLGLCKQFSSYYSLGMNEPEKRVLCEDREARKARLQLVHAARNVIAEGLRLLGIEAPEQM